MYPKTIFSGSKMSCVVSLAWEVTLGLGGDHSHLELVDKFILSSDCCNRLFLPIDLMKTYHNYHSLLKIKLFKKLVKICQDHLV